MSISTEIPNKISRIDDGVDYITNLEQSLTTRILSFLPTKDAVKTSVLSKDWVYKWTHLNNVDINASIHYNPRSKTLPDFIDRIILLCKHLTSFRLICTNCGGLTRMQAWISDFLKLGLEDFDLTCKHKDLVLPSNLLNIISLRKLKLQSMWSTFNVPEKNYAPNLTSLYLYGVQLVGGEDPNTSSMKFTFPVLETFTARACKWLNVDSVEIHAPMLTTFLSGPLGIYEDYDYSFVIVAPRLHKLTCKPGLPEKFIMDGSSIVSALLHSYGEPGNTALRKDIGLRVRKLLDGFTSLEELELSAFMIKSLKASQSVLPPCRFDKLRRLALRDSVTAAQLFELLHAAPSLKSLCINLDDWVDSDYEAMEPVPSCIARLEEVEFFRFERKASKYDLAKFFMKKGEQLKKISIVRYPRKNNPEEVKEVLSTFPHCSPCVTIDVRCTQPANHVRYPRANRQV